MSPALKARSYWCVCKMTVSNQTKILVWLYKQMSKGMLFKNMDRERKRERAESEDRIQTEFQVKPN